MDQQMSQEQNGGAVNGSSGPPAAHSGPTPTPGSKNKRTLGAETSGNSSKRPRVRDYTGCRTGSNSSGSRHVFVDQPRSHPFPSPNHLPLPLVKTTRDARNCDNVSKDQPDSRPDSELGAPLDLCIKRPTGRDSVPVAAISNRRSLDDQNSRLNESSHSEERSAPSLPVPAVFPKKRGRKPKSLLMAGMSATTVPSSASGSQAATPINENKPRKRGRPPLMSPPPNIGMDVSSGKSMARMAEDMAMISNRLQAGAFAQQQQQHLAAQSWQSLFPAAGPHPLLLPHNIREAIAQLSSLHSFPSTSAAAPISQSARGTKNHSDPQNQARHARDQDSDPESDADSKDDFRPDLNEEDIRAPLKFGWRRYTIISRISSSGIRGDVLYMSPEGKKLRNLSDIQRVSFMGMKTFCSILNVLLA